MCRKNDKNVCRTAESAILVIGGGTACLIGPQFDKTMSKVSPRALLQGCMASRSRRFPNEYARKVGLSGRLYRRLYPLQQAMMIYNRPRRRSTSPGLSYVAWPVMPK